MQSSNRMTSTNFQTINSWAAQSVYAIMQRIMMQLYICTFVNKTRSNSAVMKVATAAEPPTARTEADETSV